MSHLTIRKRLKRARQRAREKYEAIKAATDRNDKKIEVLKSALSEIVAENKSQIDLAGRQPSAADQPEREHQNNERSMRRSTTTIAWFTIVLGLVGIAGAIISGLTLFAIQGQLGSMQDDQRPWVKIKALEMGSDLLFNDKGIHFVLKYHLENVGRSVAISSSFYTIVKQDWYNSAHQAVQNDVSGSGIPSFFRRTQIGRNS
jgi:hypothetical protein